MRIAVVSTMRGAPWGGSEELWARMAGEALTDGHEVALFVHRWPVTPPAVRSLEERGARVHRRGRSYRFAAERLAGRLLQRRVSIPSLPIASAFRDLRRFKAHVVVISEGAFFSFLHIGDVCEWLARSATPYVVVCQYVADAYNASESFRELALEFYRGAFRVAFVARRNLETAQRQLVASLTNGIVVQNPVTIADRKPVAFPPPGPARLASVARLDVRDKGQDVLLEALSQAAWRVRDWQLNLFGTGDDERYLRSLAGMYGVADRTRFRGHIADVRSIWAENDLLVLPSRAEGTPLALLEAMLSGRGAVVSDVGGNAEWVEDGVTGFVAEAPTARSFGAALERAWHARERWESIGERAHDVAMRRLDCQPGRTLLEIVLAGAHGRDGSRA